MQFLFLFTKHEDKKGRCFDDIKKNKKETTWVVLLKENLKNVSNNGINRSILGPIESNMKEPNKTNLNRKLNSTLRKIFTIIFGSHLYTFT